MMLGSRDNGNSSNDECQDTESEEQAKPPESSDATRGYVLRPLRLDDEERFLKMATASKSFHSGWVRLPLRKDEFTSLVNKSIMGDTVALAIVHESGPISGLIAIESIDQARGAANVSFAVDVRGQRQGLISSFLPQAIEWVQGEIGTTTFFAFVQAGNASSEGLLRKLGFCPEEGSEITINIEGVEKKHARWVFRKFADLNLPQNDG